VPAGSCCVDEQRREPLHPPIDGHVVDIDTSLDQELFHVTVGEPETQIPAHRQGDHLRENRKPANAEDMTDGATQRAALINQA
jgi:hypothetical protein